MTASEARKMIEDLLDYENELETCADLRRLRKIREARNALIDAIILRLTTEDE